MKEFTVTVPFQEGLHARPAVKFIRLVGSMKPTITILKNGNEYAAKSIVSLLSAGITCGQQITIRVNGEGEDECAAAIEAFFAEAGPTGEC